MTIAAKHGADVLAAVPSDHEALPPQFPFLHSFGEGSGFGVYQLVEDTLRVHDDDLVSKLSASLRSAESSVRYWTAQIAQNYPALSLRDPLIERLRDARPGTRAAAVVALLDLGDPVGEAENGKLAVVETDEEVLDGIAMVMEPGDAPAGPL